MNRFNWKSTQAWPILIAALGPWLLILGAIGLLNAIGLGVVVQAIGWLLLLVILTPIVLSVVGLWWLRHNLVAGPCPTCGYPVTTLRGFSSNCPNCGTPLSGLGQTVQRQSAPGTIDVQAVEVGKRELRDATPPDQRY
ncbi:hypothetical protein AMR42_16875 [Limnothrix sp. PR1529]|uniref:hypothetical protein n=1 Tax=Limnothrix sp. PR1529 TaxID=1704291 RepID=UPI00081EA472|nr:hypothetical protein [Limnothrix sp. PR1529]OCQ97619.1 hypothetical protein BCR12_05180 [Limnothrix sp. P13C2]PIB04715.1 hypothetical protein AMR42_16875 [Limnothrix sp. PR1529]